MVVFELRTYKLYPHNSEWLHDRFRKDTTRIFNRMGFEVVGFWTVWAGDNAGDLVYLMRWQSSDQRDVGWAAFHQDEEWIEIRRRTNSEHGPLVAGTSASILCPTDYSPMQ